MIANRLVCCLSGVLLIGASGCAGGGLLKLGQKDAPKAGPDNPVAQVVALWQPAEGTGLDGKACRGFAGQILFLTHKSAVPAEADGAVRIYLFDDQSPPEERAKPIHQFDLPADVWKTHLQDSQLGLGYTVFIPYTRKGFHEAQCSLRVRHTAPNGRVLYSEMLTVTLPGSKKQEPSAEPEEEESPVPLVTRSGSSTRRNSTEQRWRQNEQAEDVQDDIDRIVQAQAFPSESSGRNASRAPSPLNAAERQRIVREALARMARENHDPAEVDEVDEEETPAAHVPARSARISHALAETNLDEDAEEYDVPRARHRISPLRSNPAKRPSIDLDAEDTDDIDRRPIRPISYEEPAPARPKAAKHPLRQTTDADNVPKRRADTITIAVPRNGRSY